MPRSRTNHFLSQSDVEEILEIGAALAAEKDLDRLLTRILEACRHLVRADAGTLFLAEANGTESPTHLRFVVAQNDSIRLDLKEFSIPIDTKSLVGYVASTRRAVKIDDVYRIPVETPFTFNPDFDVKTGYRSKSILSVAMEDHRDELIGVVQLWNKKKDRETRLTSKNVSKQVLPFDENDQRLLDSLAAQAGIAIENARLYADIEHLFEGFIRASVTAIEARDPTTFGHSERVGTLTIDLAKKVDALGTGPYANVRFTKEELRELDYAALLHDFGKIGVREPVLVKAKKLYPAEFEAIRDRIDLFHRTIEFEYAQKKLAHLTSGGQPDDGQWVVLENECRNRLAEIQETLALIQTSNEPKVLPEGVPDGLARFAQLSVNRPDGSVTPILTPDQVFRLSVPKGSLSPEERAEIEAHVTHTFEYLKLIPWTRELRRIPDIAHAHHEKLDGSGYPRGIHSEGIPLPSKIMTVADIFDALAARDRPYKRAVPVDKALDILQMEARDKKLDPTLVTLFIDAKIYKLTTNE